MPTITAKGGAQIFYKDWGAGPVVTFSHGWPLNADALSRIALGAAQYAQQPMPAAKVAHSSS